VRAAGALCSRVNGLPVVLLEYLQATCPSTLNSDPYLLLTGTREVGHQLAPEQVNGLLVIIQQGLLDLITPAHGLEC